MDAKRKIEVFSAGCPACEETIQLVKRIACPSCDVTVLDMKKLDVANRRKAWAYVLFPPWSLTANSLIAAPVGGRTKPRCGRQASASRCSRQKETGRKA